ncbi:hypothetical protein [Haloarchaeobius baliensis]|uniref:hypothetical protein n=1 Tax=Haloarchaeobius baliensis TaxID=1670458 RepID=UPI003F885B54
MIVVATADFELYHEVVTELRDRGVTFTTVEPGDPLPEGTDVVVVAEGEAVETGEADEGDPAPGVHVVHASPDAPRRAVDAAFAYLRGGDGRTVVGVDPGRKPGIAVLAGDTVVAAFQVPRDDAAAVVEAEVADATDPVVRVGDGARLDGAAIVNELEDVRVELVDETGTTPYLGTGARGMGDVLAAVNIARLEGEVVEKREVEPTAGELQVIKDRSREQSTENRAIDEVLARRVAAGELSIEEALARHGESDEE